MNKINVRDLILKNLENSSSRRTDTIVSILLLVAASISIVTSLGIVATLVNDAVHFFAEVPLKDFFSSELAPLSPEPSFGILPLLVGTALSSLIAMLVAVPVGLTAAIYLSEFAPVSFRNTLKPIMEVLAGIPTIVYGFFAYSFVTPLLMRMLPDLEAKNVLSAGIVMGVMIIPMVTSLSEDAMSAVPTSLRDGALALGATKLEVTLKVVVPAAISGIVASFILGISRAIGETMIVVIASGSSKKLTFDITHSMQTMTSYIVEFTGGDAGAGTIGYYSLYAVGLLLFVFTLIMNLIAQYIAKRYREVY